MQPIEPETLAPLLRGLAGQAVYLHYEVVPAGFLRNLKVNIQEAVLRGAEPPYRLALRCQEDAWVIMEGLTHMETAATAADGAPGPTLFLCALESDQRLSRAIQISREPFTP